MNQRVRQNAFNRTRYLLLLGVLLWSLTSRSDAQIYVSGQTTGNNNGFVGLYANSGAVINPNFITLAGVPDALLLYGNQLFVSDHNNNTVGLYNATSGAAIDAQFITGLNRPFGMATDGSHLFVANSGGFTGTTISEYDLATGAVVNLGFISGLQAPTSIALADGYLYVANFAGNSVGKYNVLV